MSSIRDVVSRLVQNARVSQEETKELVETATSDATVTPQERTELKNTIERYQDAFDLSGWKELRSNAGALGVSVPKRAPLEKLDGRPELGPIAGGTKALSSLKNRNDPAVKTVQRALMTLARLEGKAELGLPKAGADGDFGAETASAVKAFQRANGLAADGIVGKLTLAKLNAALIKATHTQKAQTPDLATPITLQNARFKADPSLTRVASGEAMVAKGASGEGVKALQTALMDLGYSLPKFGADGGFGNESISALKQFQHDQKLSVTGKVDAATLGALDKAAPAPGSRAVVFPEYDQMMKDGVLTTTLGVGFDEDGSDLWERKKLLDGLASRGFAKLDVATLSDTQLKDLGLDPSTLDKQGTYFLKTFTFKGKEVRALVKYVDRYTPAPKDRFAAGFAKDDLVVYSGHARYGSGPDFDTKESAEGNFVIGVNAKGHQSGALEPAYDAHMREILATSGNDLEETKLTSDYQMMFFSGCSTKNYLDEMRGIPKNKDWRNLDVIGSNEPLYWNRMAQNAFVVLDGVMGGRSMNDMDASLVKINDGAGFTNDGFGGNAYQPH